MRSFWGRAQHAHRDVGIAAQQIFDGIGGDQLNLDPGFRITEFGDDWRQNIVGHHFAGGDPYRATDGLGSAGGLEGKAVGFCPHRFCFVNQSTGRLLSIACRDGRARKQDKSCFRFQCVDMASQRRLAQSQPIGGRRQGATLSDGKESANKVPIHINSILYDNHPILSI